MTAVLSRAWSRARRFPWMTMALVSWAVTAVGTGVAQADTGVVGFGDLLPKMSIPAGSTPSLFESTNGLTWLVDADPGIGFDQVVVSTMNSIVNVVWGLALLLAQSALYLGQWILSMLNIPGINDWLSAGLGASAAALMSWLAPTAIVIGALVAYVQHRGGEAFNQVLWVLVAATLGMSLVLTPGVWVTGTQNLRMIGTDAMLTLASPASGPDQSKPFAWPATDYAGNTPRDSMIRKANDATFRGLIVYPWCIAEFGSIAACEKYGADMVKAGADLNARKKVIAAVSRAEGGDDKPATRWLKGYNWGERLTISIGTLLVTLIFCGVLLILAFAAIGALISTVFHLVLGAFFALTWCIPGRPRQIGLRWLESLIGTVLQGIIAVGVYGASLTVLTLLYSQIDSLGGVLVVSALAITTVVTALSFRSQVSSWFGIVAGGRAGAALLGASAMRFITRGRAGGGSSSRAGSSTASRKPAGSSGGAPGGPSSAGSGGSGGGPHIAPSAPPRRRPIATEVREPPSSSPSPRKAPASQGPSGGTGSNPRSGTDSAPARRSSAHSTAAPAPGRRPSPAAQHAAGPASTRRAEPASPPARPGVGDAPPPTRRTSPRRP